VFAQTTESRLSQPTTISFRPSRPPQFTSNACSDEIKRGTPFDQADHIRQNSVLHRLSSSRLNGLLISR
jgi:hypothetical protein